MNKIKFITVFFLLCINCGKMGVGSSCKEQKDLLFDGICLPALLVTYQEGTLEDNKLQINSCLLLLLEKQNCRD